ncbi:hypothetical protein DPMN_091118 [Dreissena polymorpha]|uniref:Uncharacterized protein n=1 Tax=Dreissena polymorpha TaxID=45954 RepID=A0A9D4KZ01_DREPO|nr:hypothetical protein DPMN_091118 [Dreissena polymorpha]
MNGKIHQNNGLHMKIEYSMMIAGYTHFAPDQHFGIWKNTFTNMDVEIRQESEAAWSQLPTYCVRDI